MVKSSILFFFGASLFLQSDYRSIPNTSFLPGENYEFKIKYGFLTVGEAKVDVDPKIFSIGGRPCYKISVVGKTAGMTTLFKIRNSYVSYIDTAAFVPHKFVYSARENNYKRDQTIDFNHFKNEVIKTEKEEKKTFKIPNNSLDVVSGYYFLRTVDFSKYNQGGVFSAPLFFDEDQYTMKVRYSGKGTVNSKFGKIKVLKLNPVLPNNKLFKGENAIRIWVSDDANRVPIKIEVDFSIGTIDMDLKSHNGMRYPFSVVK
jgi:Protein of unknown function (DUF3108)